MVLIFLNAVLFLFAYLMVKKTLNYTIVDKRQKNLHRNKGLMTAFTIIYFILAVSIFWSFFTQGYYNAGAMLNRTATNILYVIMQSFLFLTIINLDMDINLTTQVLHNGQIMIIGINAKQREVFRIFMKRAPKRKAKVVDPDDENENPHEVDLLDEQHLMANEDQLMVVEGQA